MGQTRSIVVGLALVLGQTAGTAAADLGLPPPPIEMAAPGCVGCAGPWYLKGFTGLATPHVDDIFTQPFKFNDFVVEHKT